MKYIIELPDDFKPGDCHDYTNGTSCPFGARGCYARDKSKCPLDKAEIEGLCGTCSGRGLVQIAPNVRGMTTCPTCKGKGKMTGLRPGGTI